MLNNAIFYHAITRKIIVGFGNMFSNIKVKREGKTPAAEKTIDVPIAYAPKEKWLVRLEQDSSLENHTYITLPRMSFEITGLSYDSSRAINRNNYISCTGVDGTSKTFAPVPYNIEISLYILTKTQEDALQIVEQILPFFAPQLTMSINAVPESNIIMDVPVIIDGLSVSDEYDGDFETRRFITYTLNFTLKTYMYGPVSDAKPITKVFVNTDQVLFEADGDIATGNTSITITDI